MYAITRLDHDYNPIEYVQSVPKSTRKPVYAKSLHQAKFFDTPQDAHEWFDISATQISVADFIHHGAVKFMPLAGVHVFRLTNIKKERKINS